jgi:uncharacterized protein YndB with AHSA1/START domain
MEPAPSVEVRVSQRFDASPERVFDAWLDPAMASAWLFATASRPVARVEIDARVGGSFRFVDWRGGHEVEHAGEYLEIVPPRRLVFTLAMENSPRVVTRVTAEIVELDAGCELTLVHRNVPPDHATRTEGRWTGMLYGLGTKLGTSHGQRE